MDPFLAEIRIFGFPFAPKGWAQCNGQLMAISQATALFSLLGTRFGGDGRTTFGLPNLAGGRAGLGAGAGPGLSPRDLGETGGEPAVALTREQDPGHGHQLFASSSVANVSSPTATTTLARSNGVAAYGAVAKLVPMAADAVGYVPADDRPHNNLMPYQVLNYCICLEGVFPQRP